MTERKCGQQIVFSLCQVICHRRVYVHTSLLMSSIIRYLRDVSSPEGIKEQRERGGKERKAAACAIVKNGTARYILMQILYRILVLCERAIHFLSTRNSTSPTATCLSRDVCIVQLKDIQEYAKGELGGILESYPFSRSRALRLFFKYAWECGVMVPWKCAI